MRNQPMLPFYKYGAPTGEWRLDKSISFFGCSDAAAFVAIPAIHILVARFVESGVFTALLDGARFASSWSEGDQICGQGGQKFLPETGSFWFVSWRATDFGDGVRPFAEGIQSACEADPFELNLVVLRRLSHNPTQQVVGGQEDEQFALHHGRGPAG